jgi:hypothetical protein
MRRRRTAAEVCHGVVHLKKFLAKYLDRRQRAVFVTGVGLIAGSFLVYPAYPVIILLPLSGGLKITVIIIASVVSWSAFSIGVLLAGLETYEWLKELFKRRVLRW